MKIHMFTLDIPNVILLVSFCLVGLALLIYLWAILNRLPRFIKRTKNQVASSEVQDTLPPVSVIICANDQQADLFQRLPKVLEQQYPEFEVIVVLDADNEDDSADLLRQMEKDYPNLYHTFIPAGSLYLSRRKLAVTLGLKASRYDWLVFTEPDCIPASTNWLYRLAQGMHDDKDVVLGSVFCTIEEKAAAWQKRLPKLWMRRNLQTMGWALAGKPFSAMGRNLAYRKSTFIESGGFNNQLRISRGEDTLYINKIANAANTSVICHPEAFVYVSPYRSKRDWRQEHIEFSKAVTHLQGAPVAMIKAYRLFWIAFILLAVATITYAAITMQLVPIALVGVLSISTIASYLSIHYRMRAIATKS